MTIEEDPAQDLGCFSTVRQVGFYRTDGLLCVTFGSLKFQSIRCTNRSASGAEGTRYSRGLSPRTVRYTMSVVKQAFKQAVIWNMIARNPAEHVELPKKGKRVATFLTPKQVGCFLQHDQGRSSLSSVVAPLHDRCATKRGVGYSVG